jgi:hypothetical protein
MAPIEDVDIETGVHESEALAAPIGDRPSVLRSVVVWPRRHAGAIGAYVGASEMFDAHAKAFDSRNAVLNAANSGHKLYNL